MTVAFNMLTTHTSYATRIKSSVDTTHLTATVQFVFVQKEFLKAEEVHPGTVTPVPKPERAGTPCWKRALRLPPPAIAVVTPGRAMRREPREI